MLPPLPRRRQGRQCRRWQWGLRGRQPQGAQEPSQQARRQEGHHRRQPGRPRLLRRERWPVLALFLEPLDRVHPDVARFQASPRADSSASACSALAAAPPAPAAGAAGLPAGAAYLSATIAACHSVVCCLHHHSRTVGASAGVLQPPRWSPIMGPAIARVRLQHRHAESATEQ